MSTHLCLMVCALSRSPTKMHLALTSLVVAVSARKAAARGRGFRLAVLGSVLGWFAFQRNTVKGGPASTSCLKLSAVRSRPVSVASRGFPGGEFQSLLKMAAQTREITEGQPGCPPKRCSGGARAPSLPHTHPTSPIQPGRQMPSVCSLHWD